MRSIHYHDHDDIIIFFFVEKNERQSYSFINSCVERAYGFGHENKNETKKNFDDNRIREKQK